MKEVITINVGQCGNQIGTRFWEDICQEHQVSPVGYFDGEAHEHMGIHTHFSETPGNKYVPRAMLVDLDPMTLDSCRCSPYGQTFKPDNFIFGRAGAENNWAKGYKNEGSELMDYVMEALRKESEGCESLSGFSIIHATGGGTGSGTTALLLERLSEEYKKKIMTTYAVIPANKVSETTVEPYNTILTFPSLVHHADMCINIDNEALYRISEQILKLNLPTYDDCNQLISRVLCGMTSTMRMAGTTNTSLRKQHNCLTPYPDAHFYLCGYSPLNSRGVHPYRDFSVEDVMYQVFGKDTIMATFNPNDGKYITTQTILRGDFSELILEDVLVNLQRKNKKRFVPWLDYHCSYGVSSIPPNYYNNKIGATHLINHTGITRMWKLIRNSFTKMFNRRAFMSWYYDAGVCDTEFVEALESFTCLIEKYEFLESLPAYGGCPDEYGSLDLDCAAQLPCFEDISDCGLDAISCDGAMGPICLDRALFCGCQDHYCSCTDNIEVKYKVINPPAPPAPTGKCTQLSLGPWC